MSDKNSVYDFLRRFPDEEAARRFLENLKWGDEPHCPHCGCFEVSAVSHRSMPYRCRGCRGYFSVRSGSVFESSKISLHKWLMAMYLIGESSKGISSVQLAKMIGVQQKTAWFVGHRIREAYRQGKTMFAATVEADETYLGGKDKNRHESKKHKVGGGARDKEAVMGVKQRGGKTVYVECVSRVDSRTVDGVISKTVAIGSRLYTDDHRAYKQYSDGYRYTHRAVNHSVGEYIRGNVHTNGIESFWALLKRGYYGVYHYMSPKHLQRYLDEFSVRYAMSGQTTERLAVTASAMFGKRLRYRELTQ